MSTQKAQILNINKDIEKKEDKEIISKPKKQKNKWANMTPEELGKYWIENFGKDVCFNQISSEILKDGKVITEHVLKGYYLSFVSLIQKKGGKKFSKEQFFDWVEEYAKQVNPIEDFLKNLENVKEKESGHIEKLIDCLELDLSNGMTKEDLNTFIKKWIIGCIAQWKESKNPNVLMPIISGEKGCGKTYFFRNLLPENLQCFFTEKTILDEKDSKSEAQKICENLFYYMDDMDSLNKKNEAELRANLSSTFLSYRKPYGRGNVTQYRHANFCGSTNVTEIVKDVENNRRIVPIMIKGKDNSLYDSVDKQKLWIEAFQLFKNGFDYQLDKIEIERLTEISKANEVKDDLSIALLELFCIPKEKEKTIELSATDIKMELDKYRLNFATLKNISKTLKKLGFGTINKRNKDFYLLQRIEEVENLTFKKTLEDKKAKSFFSKFEKAS